MESEHVPPPPMVHWRICYRINAAFTATIFYMGGNDDDMIRRLRRVACGRMIQQNETTTINNNNNNNNNNSSTTIMNATTTTSATPSDVITDSTVADMFSSFLQSLFENDQIVSGLSSRGNSF